MNNEQNAALSPAVDPVYLRIDASRFCRQLLIACISVECMSFYLDYHINYCELFGDIHFNNLFNTAKENSIPSWLSIVQTLMVGLTVWAIWFVAKLQGKRRLVLLGWMMVASAFTYLAMDDGSEIHERLGTDFSDNFDTGENDSWFPSYGWQAAFLPFFGTGALFVMGFLWVQLKASGRRWMVFAAVGCFVFAVSLDFIEGLESDHPWNAYTIIADNWDIEDFTRSSFDVEPFDALRHFSKSLEECTEMLGMSLFWYVFMSHLLATSPDLQIVKTDTGTSGDD